LSGRVRSRIRREKSVENKLEKIAVALAGDYIAAILTARALFLRSLAHGRIHALIELLESVDRGLRLRGVRAGRF
jgi:hypothetical protein